MTKMHLYTLWCEYARRLQAEEIQCSWGWVMLKYEDSVYNKDGTRWGT
jgi:hypothetical protein